ncbi:MAG: thioesterase family protein [Thalassobaculales bacterium]
MLTSRYLARVEAAHVDYNGHMNVAYYMLFFDRATDAMLERLGLGAAYRAATGHSVFAVEAHITYGREVLEGAPLAIDSRLLAADAKRLHMFHRMTQAEAGFQAATCEFAILHVDLASRRTAPFPPEIAAALPAAVGDAPWPAEAGRAVGFARRG